MGDKTGIEWTDATWLVADVVSRHESSWASAAIETIEPRPAAASTPDFRVGLASLPSLRIQPTVRLPMLLNRGHDLDIRHSVVGLVTIDMVRNLAPPQRPTEFFTGDQSVFVDVSADIGEWMAKHLHQYVAVGCEGPPPFPIRVATTGMHYSHAI